MGMVDQNKGVRAGVPPLPLPETRGFIAGQKACVLKERGVILPSVMGLIAGHNPVNYGVQKLLLPDMNRVY